MSVFFEIVSHTVHVALMALQLAMLLRAILSWFPMEDNKFTNFLYALTEPVIYPVRALFEKMNWFQNLPIDISFLVAYILISVISMLLP